MPDSRIKSHLSTLFPHASVGYVFSYFHIVEKSILIKIGGLLTWVMVIPNLIRRMNYMNKVTMMNMKVSYQITFKLKGYDLSLIHISEPTRPY